MISDELNRHGMLGIVGGGLLELDIVSRLARYRISSMKRRDEAMKREK